MATSTSTVEEDLRLMKAARRLADQLVDVLDELPKHFDVEDGSDGEPRPNWAMKLDFEIRCALHEAGVRL